MIQFGMPTLIENSTLEENVDLCRSLGLKFIELNMNFPEYQVDGLEQTEHLIRLAKQAGIYYTIHLDENLNIADFNALVTEAYLETVRRSIEVAKKLIPLRDKYGDRSQALTLNMHMNHGVYITLPDRKVQLYDRDFDTYMRSFEVFREKCEQWIGDSDLRIVVENTDGFREYEKKAIEYLLQSPKFGLTWDIGHSKATGERDVPFILEHQEYLMHFHIHDGSEKPPKNHLALGDGEIDLAERLKLAESRNARCVLETKTIEALEKSVRWLKQDRPSVHFTPELGWMNDPNGFSYFNGEYHLFYQSNPDDTRWGSIHWGHAVSRDLVRFEYLPAALAPDQPYDLRGCFSGTALETEDGQHYIIYTGVHTGPDGRDLQQQCVAVGDGRNYVKYGQNPVIPAKDLPQGLSPYDFRDPKVFKDEDGMLRCIVAGMNEEGLGELLLFASRDGYDWHFENTFLENDGTYGTMWECPDFFNIGDTAVLLTSPIGMTANEPEYHAGNGTLCQTGTYDRAAKRFIPHHAQVVDHGFDFYAPQTLKAPDGRRILIGWMQNWATCDADRSADRNWFGQMTVARELTLDGDQLLQMPVRELENYRDSRIEYTNVEVNGKRTLSGIEGRSLDMILKVRPAERANIFRRFTMYFAKDDQHSSRIDFYPGECIFETDRSLSGTPDNGLSRRRCRVKDRGGEIELRIVMDRYSIEVFINGGEQAMTTTIPTDPAAGEICFESDGAAVMDITKWRLN